MTLDQALATPGIYVFLGDHAFFIEVLPDGSCHQLTPDKFERDGVLSRTGWRDSVPGGFYGPLARKEPS